MGGEAHRRPLRPHAWLILVLLLAACAGRQATVTPTTAPPVIVATTESTAPTTTPPTTGTSSAPTTTQLLSTTTAAVTTTQAATTQTPTTTTQPPPIGVRSPGEYAAGDLEIRLTFRSEVNDVTTGGFETTAMAILTDPRGWTRSGFTFVVDDTSELTVVLAEPNRVDDLCLPLETKGYASCQNGAVVALNAQRWRTATGDWDSTIDDYRRYLVTHEVGHLIGLRHPAERCPPGTPRSAVMEPQTGGLVCAGNGWPLEWEIEWATNRPAVVGPLPDWDGPRPEWP